MENRVHLCFVLLLLVQRVSLEKYPMSTFVQETVILPCLNSNGESAEVFWRYNDTKTVLDISNGRVSFLEQEVMFRDRVDSFPEEYAKGNYSIRLKEVKLSDTGVYSCFIPQANKQSKTELTVKERKSSERNAGTGNGDVRETPNSILLSISSLLGFILLHP